MGRVDHFLMGEQSGADPERVRLTRINHYDNFNSIKKNRCHLIKQLFRWRWPRSLVASTSLWRWTLGMPSSSTPTFFTPGVCMKKEIHHQSFNTFSDQNKSDLRRWVMISSYNQVEKYRLSIPQVYRCNFRRPGIVLSWSIIALSTPPFIKWQTMR